ncbi:MBL fold metallo-hydrolase [Clostridium peptidivorans]|uniref:MBL fold metallo-hydrolase n=1 Tax=Clostridium peptidivorans TaxID=100174 RepID=UPI000BE339A4|nr:MBL fold metallo-hydrolase [Clostridium peptidivorans]
MNNIINVTSGKGSSTAFLILGEDKTALIDCGMAYCASNLIRNIQQVLEDGRKLEYILLSHSHYDHIGAVPYLRKVWPDVKVLAAEYAQNVLTKESALKTIRELGNGAAALYGESQLLNYDDNLMKVDEKISDGDLIDLGGTTITVLETLGHTKCSLSFLVNNQVIFPSETSGVMSKSGKLYSSFIISYKETIDSIKKCQKTNAKYIVSPHLGFVSESETPIYWEKCMEAANRTRNFVLELFQEGFDEDKIFEEYKKNFQDKEARSLQPDKAFEINNRAMIKSIINNK